MIAVIIIIDYVDLYLDKVLKCTLIEYYYGYAT